MIANAAEVINIFLSIQSKKREVIIFLEQLKELLGNEDFNMDTDLTLISKKKQGDDQKYSTPYTLLDLDYDTEDIVERLKELTVEEYSKTKIDKDDLNPPLLFVFGKDITNSYSSPSVAENNPTTILVKVSHVAARLDFSQFDVTLKGFEGDLTVVFDEAKFVNLQQNGKIVEGDASVNVKDGAFLNRSNRIGTRWTDMGTAYGYANQYKQDSKTNTALYVKFTVDGRTFEKIYPINPAGITKEVDHNGIKGGYLYDIKVRWTITPDWGDSTIEFYTRDWVHNSIPEIVL